MIVILGICLAVIGVALLSLFVAFPLIVAVVATFQNSARGFRNSKLYVGRVWHTRLQPKRHGFDYPIFMFALDLEEDFGNFLWPLVQFREADHLKNGEELQPDKPKDNALVDRILRFVSTKTNGNFQPTLESHRVMLLTHLCYYGYNFNPVSFYYVVDKQTNELTALLGEVSNTPWTEMYCYVLHPSSIDKVQTNIKEIAKRTQYNYSFPKEFHVSPFMEMDYWYDWSFVGVPSSIPDDSSSLTVINSMRSRSSDQMVFIAKLIMESQNITPWSVAWQMIRFPVFCMIIQIWIHYQAAWLFIKGIVYIPHPEESETTASKMIASIMTPFFAIRDRINPKSKTM